MWDLVNQIDKFVACSFLSIFLAMIILVVGLGLSTVVFVIEKCSKKF